jgi:hypothetical protein
MLSLLLRKKLEPDVEELVSKGTEAAAALRNNDAGDGRPGPDELARHWKAAKEWAGARINAYASGEANDPFTRAERELGVANVRTGLRRDLEGEYQELQAGLEPDEAEQDGDDEEAEEENDDDYGDEEMEDADPVEAVAPSGGMRRPGSTAARTRMNNAGVPRFDLARKEAAAKTASRLVHSAAWLAVRAEPEPPAWV